MAADDRRAQLLDAAADLIAENGFDGLIMEAVTTRAGVSKALGYAYFPRFEDLLHALFTREFSAIYLNLQAALDQPGTFEERLARKVHAYFDIIGRRRDVMLQLQRHLQGSEYRRERRARLALWEDYVAKAIQEEYGAPETTAKTAARLFMRVDEACIDVWYRHGYSREEMEQACIRFQISGLMGMLAEPVEASPAMVATPSRRAQRGRHG
jgi:AcrR family transcriptional regulator